MAKLDIKLVPTQMIATSLIDSNKGQIEGVKANPRVLRDDKFRKLKKSIQDNPDMMALRELMVYEHEGRYVTIGGNQRLEALRSLKIAEAPCKVIPADTTPEQLNAYIVLDNAPFGEWDWDALANEWEAQDLSDWGVDFPEDWAGTTPTEEEKEAVEDDFDETRDEVPTICKDGDIWQLGEHRLMCGDSTDTGSVALLMNGEKAMFCFTDPPYGVAIGDKNKLLNEKNGSHSIEENIKNDNISTSELYDVLVKAMTNLRLNSADDASYYVSSPQGGELGLMMMMMKDSGLTVRHMLIWVKNCATFSMGRLDYDYRHEPIFYTWTKSHHFYGGVSNSVIEDELDVDKLKKDELVKIVKEMLSEKHPTSIIKENKPLKNDLHPTMKPVKLVARFMQNNSKIGDPVIDLFGGSGTTLIAAEQLGRRCFMMELDAHYCDVILARWEKLTGQKAQLLKNVNQPIENSRII